MRKLLLLLLLATAMAAAKAESTLTVYAAASMSDAIKAVDERFAAGSDTTFKLNLGSSGTLARQMEQGGKVDVFISASKDWADYVVAKDLVEKGSVKSFLGNALVLVAPSDSPLQPFELDAKSDLPGLFKGRLSIGDPEHVPAGKYAVAALGHFGWLKPLEKRLLPGMSVRDALMVVELGEADMGVVYSSDAASSKKVKVLATFPADACPPIVYYCALGKGASPEAAKYQAFLLGDKAAELFKTYGFAPSATN